MFYHRSRFSSCCWTPHQPFTVVGILNGACEYAHQSTWFCRFAVNQCVCQTCFRWMLDSARAVSYHQSCLWLFAEDVVLMMWPVISLLPSLDGMPVIRFSSSKSGHPRKQWRANPGTSERQVDGPTRFFYCCHGLHPMSACSWHIS